MSKQSEADAGVANSNKPRPPEAGYAERVGRGLRSAVDLLARAGVPSAAPSAQGTNLGASIKASDDPLISSVARAATETDHLALRIAHMAARLIGAAQVDPDADFFQLGGSSIDAVGLVSVLARELGVQVTLDDLFADGRPRRLAERWLAKQRPLVEDRPPRMAPQSNPLAPALGLGFESRPAMELGSNDPSRDRIPDAAEVLRAITDDLALSDQLPWVPAPRREPPRCILITGATGFLGSHVLFDLLRQSDAKVLCLVRAKDDGAAQKRLAHELEARDLPWSPELERRIEVVAGDLQEPRLGWSEDRWNVLASEVDSIVNVGATVDFVRGYLPMRKANVLGPLTLSAFAATARIKPLHHVSTISIFDEIGIPSIGEDDSVAHVDKLFTGYEQTKWAAEAVLRRARERGLVVTFCRPGGIGGHTETGVYNPQDLSSAFVAAWVVHRTMPEFRYMNVAPVNWVSRITAEIALDPKAWGYNYHLTGKPLSLREVQRNMSLGGMNIGVMSFSDWRRNFLERMAKDPIPHLDFMVRVLQNRGALKLIEATLSAPAAKSDRTDAFVKRRKLPPASKFDMQAMLATTERLAKDGRTKLPGRDDPPYLAFTETLRGKIGPLGGETLAEATFELRVSVASFYQLLRQRRVDLRGKATCGLLSSGPLTIETGDFLVRPHDGIPRQHGTEHPLLRYAMVLVDDDGQRFWLAGTKTARPGRDLWQQARTLEVEVGRDGEPASFAGELVVPADTYVAEQIDGIEVSSGTPRPQRGMAKLVWLAWLGSQFALGFSEPMLRYLVELLDVRFGLVPEEGELE